MQDVERDAEGKSSPQFAPLLGAVLGLLFAAIGTLVYAWLRREPVNPLVADRAAVTAMLQRTTIAVVVSALLVGIFFFVGRGHRRGTDERARWVTRLSPVLLVVSIAGVLLLIKGSTAEVFEQAARAQLGLEYIEVTALARASWWFACLAVLGLFFAGVTTDIPAGRPAKAVPKAQLLVVGGSAALVAIVAIGAVLIHANGNAFRDATATRIEASALPTVTGERAYEQAAPIGTGQLLPAGAGFVRLSGDDRVEAYDGATGQRRWSFHMPDLLIWDIRSTGTGPDSVVVAEGYVAFGGDGSGVLIGIDATTGEPMWTRADVGAFAPDHIATGTSSQVVLIMEFARTAGVERRTWTALEPRTGRTMWTKAFEGPCSGNATITETAVLERNCDSPAYVVATVLDPVTGAERGTITASNLGVDGASPDDDRRVRLNGVKGDLALYWVPTSAGGIEVLVDIATRKPIKRLPPEFSAALVDERSLALYRTTGSPKIPSPVTILDLETDSMIETPWVSARLGNYRGDTDWQSIVRAGQQWVTFLPDASIAAQLEDNIRTPLPLRTVDQAGAPRTLANPCPPDSPSHYLATVPGAVLAYCGRSVVGVR